MSEQELLPPLPQLPPTCEDKLEFVENLTRESNRIAQNARAPISIPGGECQNRKLGILLESGAARLELDYFRELCKKS